MLFFQFWVNLIITQRDFKMHYNRKKSQTSTSAPAYKIPAVKQGVKSIISLTFSNNYESPRPS